MYIDNRPYLLKSPDTLINNINTNKELDKKTNLQPIYDNYQIKYKNSTCLNNIPFMECKLSSDYGIYQGVLIPKNWKDNMSEGEITLSIKKALVSDYAKDFCKKYTRLLEIYNNVENSINDTFCNVGIYKGVKIPKQWKNLNEVEISKAIKEFISKDSAYYDSFVNNYPGLINIYNKKGKELINTSIVNKISTEQKIKYWKNLQSLGYIGNKEYSDKFDNELDRAIIDYCKNNKITGKNWELEFYKTMIIVDSCLKHQNDNYRYYTSLDGYNGSYTCAAHVNYVMNKSYQEIKKQGLDKLGFDLRNYKLYGNKLSYTTSEKGFYWGIGYGPGKCDLKNKLDQVKPGDVLIWDDNGSGSGLGHYGIFLGVDKNGKSIIGDAAGTFRVHNTNLTLNNLRYYLDKSRFYAIVDA